MNVKQSTKKYIRDYQLKNENIPKKYYVNIPGKGKATCWSDNTVKQNYEN